MPLVPTAELRGLTLPVAKSVGGYFAAKGPREVIAESLRMILGTYPGERVLLPEFGSRMRELVFETADEVFAVLARTYVIEAVRRWERRVTIIDAVVVLPNDGTAAGALLQPNEAQVTLRYIVNSQNLEDNLEFTVTRQL